MDVVIATRLGEVQHLIEEEEIYKFCGVDSIILAKERAESIKRDIKGLRNLVSASAFKKDGWDAWEGPSPCQMAKYSDLMIIVSALQRKMILNDIDGCKWCLNEAAKYLPTFTADF